MDKDQSTIHITLQGKGGIGKTMISSFLAQYLMQNGVPVNCYDADPVNASLGGFKKLNAQHVALMQNGEINSRVFDHVFEDLLSIDHGSVIDCGASSFVPLTKYLLDNKTFEFLEEHGKKATIHCPIAGGQSLAETLSQFKQLVTTLPASVKVVIWLNEYYGLIEFEGKAFIDMKVAKDHAQSIAGIVLLPKQTEHTFATDIREMLTQKLTFDEVSQSNNFGLMAKQRIVIFQRYVFDQLDKLNV